MLMVISLLAFCFCIPANAQETITDFSTNSVPVLNEELRKTESNLNKLNYWGTERKQVSISITSGYIEVNQGYVLVDTEALASSDNLDTINGGTEGQILTLLPVSSARTIVVKDGTGNLKLSGDYTMDNSEDSLTLIKRDLSWYELARSNNGV